MFLRVPVQPVPQIRHVQIQCVHQVAECVLLLICLNLILCCLVLSYTRNHARNLIPVIVLWIVNYFIIRIDASVHFES